jgi:ABC-2 type transport system ATP-binding protein
VLPAIARMIDVSNLTKSYGDHAAVRGVSFTVGQGEVVGFLGPNGAGKSTTLRVLAGFLGMTSGSVTIAGHDILESPLEARAAIGYMPEATPLYGEMRVEEYLRFRAELKGVARRERASAVEQAMEEAHVREVATTLIGSLSKGFKQRVGLADALVARPPILILDEPTAGLDPNQIREVRALIRELGTRHTILLSTHILTEVESTCSRALVIAKGRLVAEGSLDELRERRRAGRARLTVRLADGKGALSSLLRSFAGVRRVEVEGEDPRLALVTVALTFGEDITSAGETLEAIIGALYEKGYNVREAAVLAASLDDVFKELTEDRLEGEATPPADTADTTETAEEPS